MFSLLKDALTVFVCDRYWANEALCNWMLKCPQDKVQDINIGEGASSQGVSHPARSLTSFPPRTVHK